MSSGLFKNLAAKYSFTNYAHINICVHVWAYVWAYVNSIWHEIIYKGLYVIKPNQPTTFVHVLSTCLKHFEHVLGYCKYM